MSGKWELENGTNDLKYKLYKDLNLTFNQYVDLYETDHPPKFPCNNFSVSNYTDNLFKKILQKSKNLENSNLIVNQEFDHKKYTNDLIKKTLNKQVENENLRKSNNEDEFEFVKINDNLEENSNIKIQTKKIDELNLPKKFDKSQINKTQSNAKTNHTKNVENSQKISGTFNSNLGNKKVISDEDKILKIQGKWKSKIASKAIEKMREKVFILQRSFRSLLIKKYDLPTNHFYNEIFIRKQIEIFEKNAIENLKILFPSYIPENDERDFSQSKLNSKLSQKTSTHSKLTLAHNPFEEGKIHLFASIIDIDFMVETDEVYEKLWASSYDTVLQHCISNNSPIQIISVGAESTACLNNKGKVFTFGWNNYGQCGVPVKSSIINKNEMLKEKVGEDHHSSYTKNLKVLNKIEGIRIPQIEEVTICKSIVSGEDHTLMLDKEGDIWVFGINLNGQLGLGHKQMVEKPTKLSTLAGKKIQSIKTEGEVNFAISSQGEAFMWPWNDKNVLNYSPLKISLKNELVSRVCCGSNFVMLLCNSGHVYSMGKTNNYGQLGHGDQEPRYRPSLIEFFQVNQERVTQISCGFKHTVCKTSNGRVYTWGLGVKGQLGHGDYNNYSLPHQVNIENSNFSKVIQVAAGFRSTYFLNDSRKIYFAGCTNNNLMQNLPSIYNYSEKIPEFRNEANYSIVRLLTTWNKSFSILYATVADTSTLKLNPVKLSHILNNLSTKWNDDLIDPPYIEAISGYFSGSCMKKPRNEK